MNWPTGHPKGVKSDADMPSVHHAECEDHGKGQVPARLFMIFARKSPTAVIFRRGPSKWVRLVKWNTKTDVFEPGQWFNGRIYERRSDLSPDGSLLIYFAQKISARSEKDTEYTYAWTAISRPPFLTALALWPKGNCWHGGGLFKKDRVVLLNHKPEVAKPHKEHKPHGLQVIPNKNAQGEDDPIFSQRLQRDGWELKSPWQVENRGYPKLFHTIQPEMREKANRSRTHTIRLTRSIECLDYSEEFAIRNAKQPVMTVINRARWADWDQQGRLVFARDGKIFAASISDDGHLTEELLVDLNPAKPEPIPTPEWATKW
jgi:hypothetical protein